MTSCRSVKIALLVATLVAPGAAVLAQAPSATPAPAAAPAPPADPVMARVDGTELRLSDVLASAAEALPPEMRAVPPDALMSLLPPNVFQQLVDRAVTDRAMVLAARRDGLDRDPAVRQRIRAAEEEALRDALLRREVLPRIEDSVLRARWERDRGQQGAGAGAPQGEEEVRARHILLNSEADARAVLAEIQRGGNFEEVARRRGTDPSARQGGDLGFFKRADMVPEFAAAAFALQAGQVGPQPVRSQFGWHVIRVEERRRAQGPSFEEARDQLRQTAIQEEVTAAVERVRQAARIEFVPIPAHAQQPAAPPAAPPVAPPAAPPVAPATPAPQRR